jgi:Kef-type K+ transport system membrane component KefB
MSDSALAALVFLQLAVIPLTCRLVGWIARWFGRPQVAAEMVAGFARGYSFFGRAAPGIHGVLVPPDVRR